MENTHDEIFNTLYKETVEYTLNKKVRVQRTYWFVLILKIIGGIDAHQAFAEYCETQKNKTTTIELKHALLATGESFDVCIVCKKEGTNFSKDVYPPQAVLQQMKLRLPKSKEQATQNLLHKIKGLPSAFTIPTIASKKERLSTKELLTDNLLAHTMSGKSSHSSFLHLHSTKYKMLAVMRTELKELSKQILKHGDIIPTYWGVNFTFLPPSEKKRHFWLYGPSNVGKSFFVKSLLFKYLAAIISPNSPTHADVSSKTQIVILDEFKTGNQFDFSILNTLCDGNFTYKHLYADQFRTMDTIIIVMANVSIENTYQKDSKDIEHIHVQLNNRFIQVNLEELLKEQDILPLNYLKSKHRASDDDIQKFYAPDPLLSASETELIEMYQSKLPTVMFEICVHCGSKVKPLPMDLNSFDDPQANDIGVSKLSEISSVQEEGEQFVSSPDSSKDITESALMLSLNSAKTAVVAAVTAFADSQPVPSSFLQSKRHIERKPDFDDSQP